MSLLLLITGETFSSEGGGLNAKAQDHRGAGLLFTAWSNENAFF